ncbi:MAG: recombination regulator RecX [Elusimicrobiota bacterium]|jgi:regulatory protein|nr:recombination regulator RecX [Elusimicrobiota bacterium]
MQIKKITKIKTKKNLFKVYFDDDTDIVLTADSIVKFNLNIGLQINQDEYAEILSYDKRNQIMDDALGIISKRSVSEKMIFDKLISKGYEENSARNAINRLKELGYIDDEKYAQTIAEYLLKKSKGSNMIDYELQKRGIEPAIIAKTLANINKQKTPCGQILEIINKKFKNSDLKDEKSFAKTALFFERRGFLQEDIEKALQIARDGK